MAATRTTLATASDVIAKTDLAVRGYQHALRLRQMARDAFSAYLTLVRDANSAGATQDEIAERLGITTQAVYLHLKETR